MLWVMPAPATAVAPCEEKTQDKTTLSLQPPAPGRGGGGSQAGRTPGGISTCRHKPSHSSACHLPAGCGPG